LNSFKYFGKFAIMVSTLKKIFFALFFFQLAIAVASANAESILTHYKKSGPAADAISLTHQRIIGQIQQQEVQDDSPDSDNNEASHTRNIIRFLPGRVNYSSALLPGQQLLHVDVTSIVEKQQNQNKSTKGFLPAYYNFLFRLSPF
jgi:hypothetical protein